MKDDQETYGLIAMIVIGMALVPKLLPAVGEKVGRWLLDHGVLVSEQAALFTVPGLNAGPDLRRIAIAALAVVVMALVRHRTLASRRLERSQS